VIILASRSPQRRALVNLLGVRYRVIVPAVNEGADPLDNARAKARAVLDRIASRPAAVIACDTEVLLDGRPLGKPPDADRAREMLEALSGRAHLVRSALVVAAGGRLEHRIVDTTVRFRDVDRDLGRWYVATGEWRDRAGGYAIQGAGAVLVQGIEGDHTNVIGLPLSALADMLGATGLAPWSGRQYSGG
jgi:septum formation protein